MNLSKSLKVKNSLVGKLNRYKQILLRENSRRNDNVSKVNPAQIYDEMLFVSEKLGRLKAAIAKVNIGIYDKIERMAELKDRITYLQSLNTREGEEIVLGYNQDKLVYQWTTFINNEKRDKLVQELQLEIEKYQDDTDLYNTTTIVDFNE